jgi:hypothetical protein
MGVDPNVVMDKLVGLCSPDAIAEYLLDEGIVGKRGFGDSCPVANYIRRETGLVTFVSLGEWGVEPETIHFGTPNREMPYVVGRFVNNFDNGMYPDLIE